MHHSFDGFVIDYIIMDEDKYVIQHIMEEGSATAHRALTTTLHRRYTGVTVAQRVMYTYT